MKVGDTVRYLNAVGGGVVRRIDGKIAYVEEDGFETPTLIKDLVVVVPAGYEGKQKNANIMFDQKAFDDGKKAEKPATIPAPTLQAPEPELPIEETEYGEKMNLVLAFEPIDIKKLSTTEFAAVLVNDSNFFITFNYLRKGDDEREWTLVHHGEVRPNEFVDIDMFRHENLNAYAEIAIQGVAYKKDKPFKKQQVIDMEKKLNLSKFYKLHCFKESEYFDTQVIEIPIVKDGVATKEVVVEPERIREAMTMPNNLKELQNKYKGDKGKEKGKQENPGSNPNKLLPLIEVDLHIGELLDSTAGLSNSDMLSVQLDTVKKTMERHRRRIGQKIVFIHGKGEGVLRKAVWEMLKRDYPKAELQDASFREYGFGATLVTIH